MESGEVHLFERVGREETLGKPRQQVEGIDLLRLHGQRRGLRQRRPDLLHLYDLHHPGLDSRRRSPPRRPRGVGTPPLPGALPSPPSPRYNRTAMSFPETRLRRFRRTPALRRLVRETRLSLDNLVLPLFVCPGEGVANPVSSMPGVFQHSVDRIVETCREAFAEGIRAVLLFGLPEYKDAEGSAAWSPDGIVQRALRALAAEVPGLVKIVDVCFCEYTDHGHCGVLHGHEVDNDATLANLAKQSVSLAEAGADVIAPSDMMDGRVGAIRQALDKAGF